MVRVREFFKKISNGLYQAVRRFPFAIALAAIAAITMIILNHTGASLTSEAEEVYIRIAMTAFLGIPAALAVQMLIELYSKMKVWFGVILRLSLGTLLVVYFFFGLYELEMSNIIRYFSLTVFLWGIFLAVPFLKGREYPEVFTYRVVWQFAITAFYGLIIFGGVSGILFAMDKLLDVPVKSEHYIDALLIISGGVLPMFLFSGIPSRKEDLSGAIPRFFKILLIYVLMPILTAYTAVLYFYFIRLLVTRNWPDGILVNLVLWYSIAGIVTLYLARPVTGTNKWAKKFDSWFPVFLILPIVMMFVSMFIRLSAYGLTEPRYFVLAGGVWVLAMAAFLIMKKGLNRRNVIIPITISIIAFLSVVGPWNAFCVSRLSQNQRLETVLEQNGILVNGEFTPHQSLPANTQQEIRSIVYYFHDNHNLSYIRVFPEDNNIETIESLTGVEMHGVGTSVRSKQYHYRIENTRPLIPLEGYDYALWMDDEGALADTSKGELKVTYSGESNRYISIKLDEWEVLSQNICQYAEVIMEEYPESRVLPWEVMTFSQENEKVAVKIYFTELVFSVADGDINHSWADFVLLIRIK